MNDNMTGGAGTAVSASRIIAQSPIGILYEHSIVALPAAWAAVIGILIWKGKTRSVWTRQGFNYDTFKLVAQVPGSLTRINNLLQSLNLPKNKLQLARELGMDWQTIDGHMEMLERSGLVDELTRVGNSRYYIISERGKRILSLLADSDSKNSVTK
ncbi:MAG TPA: helix-turn-helix domain-containing protein [Nitrososphaera sp.]|nr:helix-turn-helix domain-containing protein [Nitrososphaera sp.]